MKLYTAFRSSASFRVRIALNLKGLAYQPAFVHLARGEHRKAEYAAINPQALIPTFEADGVRIVQSLAIIEVLGGDASEPAVAAQGPGRTRARPFACATGRL